MPAFEDVSFQFCHTATMPASYRHAFPSWWTPIPLELWAPINYIFWAALVMVFYIYEKLASAILEIVNMSIQGSHSKYEMAKERDSKSKQKFQTLFCFNYPTHTCRSKWRVNTVSKISHLVSTMKGSYSRGDCRRLTLLPILQLQARNKNVTYIWTHIMSSVKIKE